MVRLPKYFSGDVIDQYLSSDNVNRFRIDAVLAVLFKLNEIRKYIYYEKPNKKIRKDEKHKQRISVPNRTIVKESKIKTEKSIRNYFY